MSVPRIYGMLFVAEAPERHVNLAAAGGDSLTVYVRNAVTCAASARAAGMAYELVTNRADLIDAILEAQGLGGSVQLRDHRFTLEVPAALPFRSAHFKLDVMKTFAEGTFGDAVALVDIDAVVLRSFAITPGDRIHAYDLTHHTLPAYGVGRVARDLAALLGRRVATPRWFGGEFVAGSANAFVPLAEQIERLWPRYIADTASFHHVGDEMVLTAALMAMTEEGAVPVEAGAGGLVARWWSTRTLSRIETLSEASRCAVLHLPADKAFLAAAASQPFSVPDFLSSYRSRAARGRHLAAAKNIVDLARLRAPQHLPRIQDHA